MLIKILLILNLLVIIITTTWIRNKADETSYHQGMLDGRITETRDGTLEALRQCEERLAQPVIEQEITKEEPKVIFSI